MLCSNLRSLLLVCVLFGQVGLAHADEVAPPAAPAVTPVVTGAELPAADAEAEDITAELARNNHLLLRPGIIGLSISGEINLGKDQVGKPISIAPDLWYGVSQRLSLGLTHSAYATTGFWGGVASSFCVSSAESCPHRYGRVGVQSLVLLHHGQLSLAATGGILVSSAYDPFHLDGRLGIEGRWSAEHYAIRFSPQIVVGLNQRSADRDALSVPIAIMYTGIFDRVAIGLQTGLRAPFHAFADNFTIPVGIGGLVNTTDSMMIGLSITFTQLVAGGDVKGAALDGRAMAVTANWRI